MQELFEIIIATLIVAAVGYPLVYFFDKWKKEMEQDEEDQQEK